MNSDADSSKFNGSRRPRPEVAVYRPGSGPLRKSSSNVENIKPGLNGPQQNPEASLVSGMRAVSLESGPELSKSPGPKGRKTEARTPKPKKDTIPPVKPKKDVAKPEEKDVPQQDLRERLLEKRGMPKSDTSSVAEVDKKDNRNGHPKKTETPPVHEQPTDKDRSKRKERGGRNRNERARNAQKAATDQNGPTNNNNQNEIKPDQQQQKQLKPVTAPQEAKSE